VKKKQPKLTIQMEQSERDRLKREASRLHTEGRLPAPTIAALVRAAVGAFLEEPNLTEALEMALEAIANSDAQFCNEALRKGNIALERAGAALARKEER